jgi:hypothetical protein
MSPLLLLLAAAGVTFPRGLGPIDTGAPAQDLSARSCAGCHSTAHAEWQDSRHGRAWTNAIFQREYKQEPLDWCVHCHAPLEEQFTQVRAGGGALADEGVTCAVCHLREGRMQARTRRPGSPHDTVARADFGGPAFCGGCHQFNFPLVDRSPPGPRVAAYSEHPMQDTVAQHARGPRAGTECLQCHRDTPGGHSFPGGHDPRMLARALTLDACRARGRLQVGIDNVGAGHNVPTGDLHRHLVLRVWRSGSPERLHETVLGRRFAPAPGGAKRTVADTSLRAGERRTIAVPLAGLGPPEAGDRLRLELRLVYTIDEFPFRGRELPVPTWATMVERELDLGALRACPL